MLDLRQSDLLRLFMLTRIRIHHPNLLRPPSSSPLPDADFGMEGNISIELLAGSVFLWHFVTNDKQVSRGNFFEDKAREIVCRDMGQSHRPRQCTQRKALLRWILDCDVTK